VMSAIMDLIKGGASFAEGLVSLMHTTAKNAQFQKKIGMDARRL